jgi:hypothetical protein
MVDLKAHLGWRGLIVGEYYMETDPILAMKLGWLAAVVGFILAQVFSKFFIEPLYELRKTIGEVRFALWAYAPEILTIVGLNKRRAEIARLALHSISGELVSKLDAVPWYWWFQQVSFGSLQSRNEIEDAARNLRALSTYIGESTRIDDSDSLYKRQALITKIERGLKLRPLK